MLSRRELNDNQNAGSGDYLFFPLSEGNILISWLLRIASETTSKSHVSAKDCEKRVNLGMCNAIATQTETRHFTGNFILV